MKNNTKTRETHSINFRKAALENLVKGYEKLKPEFDEALKKDLGMNPFMSNFLAHAVSLSEIKDCIDGVANWAKEVPVKTPVGKFSFI